jgi:hypothetical protein
MKNDGAGDARAVGTHLKGSLPSPWTWEARAGGLAIGTLEDFKNTGSSWVYVHFGRSSRWVYLIQPLLEWALENGYRDLMYPEPEVRWAGYGWAEGASAQVHALVEAYVASQESDQ